MPKKNPIANELFWKARQRVGLSRSQLADQVNQVPIIAECKLGPVNENWIGRIEQGRIGGGMCDERMMALCICLEVDNSAEIGLIAERRLPTRLGPARSRAASQPVGSAGSIGQAHPAVLPSPRIPRVDGLSKFQDFGAASGVDYVDHCEQFLPQPNDDHSGGEPHLADLRKRVDLGATLTADYPTAADRLNGLSADTPTPSAIGWNDVEQMRFITRTLALSENTFGGGFSSEASVAQLRYSTRLLEASASDDVRSAMFEAVGNLSGVVGFSTFDISNFRSAKICFEFELWCAEQGKSWGLRASALSDLARLAIYVGDLENALSLIELAQVRSDLLTKTTRAMLAALRSRLLAISGRHKEAQSELQRSDELFAERSPAEDPPWMCYYDEAEHQGSTGRALVPIAIRESDPGLAATRMQRAISLHDADHPRSRALSRTRLASLLMKVGDPREAATAGRESLVESTTVKSTRLRAELERLVTVAAPHKGISEVADLIHDITGQRRPAVGH